MRLALLSPQSKTEISDQELQNRITNGPKCCGDVMEANSTHGLKNRRQAGRSGGRGGGCNDVNAEGCLDGIESLSTYRVTGDRVLRKIGTKA